VVKGDVAPSLGAGGPHDCVQGTERVLSGGYSWNKTSAKETERARWNGNKEGEEVKG